MSPSQKSVGLKRSKRSVQNAIAMSKDPIKTDIYQAGPVSLLKIVGQRQVVEYLKVSLNAYDNLKKAGNGTDLSFGPVLFAGPSGTGKTMTAVLLHSALGNEKLIETNGETLKNKAELYAAIVHADSKTTLFVDEAQGLNTPAQHILLTALSERKLYVPAGTHGSGSHTLPLANFTTILATTHEYLLQEALRNRIRIYCRFEYYAIDDLTEIVRQRVQALQWQVESDHVLMMIAQASKQTPRLALNRNLMTARSVAVSQNRRLITQDDVKQAFAHLQIDCQGLDKLDRSYLTILCELRRASLGVLSSRLSLPGYTIQRVVEPYLLSRGFIFKEGSVRLISQRGIEYLQNTPMYSWRFYDV